MSLHPFIALSVLRNGLIGTLMQKESTSMNENAQPVENNQKSELEDFRPFTSTTVSLSIDNLTHVIAKLLQTAMLVEKHLADISKAIDRVAR